ncbi:hypothetical protein FF2_027067 [Malus domestica]
MLSKLPTNVPPHLSLRFLKIFCNSGDLQRARHVFDQIPEPDLRARTMLMSYQATRDMGSSIAKACAALGDVRNIKELHNEVIRFGFHSDVSLGNAMVDMFGKCRYFDGARRVFDGMVVKDVVSWTSLCSRYVN